MIALIDIQIPRGPGLPSTHPGSVTAHEGFGVCLALGQSWSQEQQCLSNVTQVLLQTGGLYKLGVWNIYFCGSETLVSNSFPQGYWKLGLDNAVVIGWLVCKECVRHFGWLNS